MQSGLMPLSIPRNSTDICLAENCKVGGVQSTLYISWMF